MGYPTHGEYSQVPSGLGQFSPGDLLYDTVKRAYVSEVVNRASPWLGRQGQSFGTAIVDGTGQAWRPTSDPQYATLYTDFVRPLVDPFAAGVKAKIVPFAVSKATAAIGPVAIIGGLLVGFLVGRASR